jgi:hypothetical protein
MSPLLTCGFGRTNTRGSPAKLTRPKMTMLAKSRTRLR